MSDFAGAFPRLHLFHVALEGHEDGQERGVLSCEPCNLSMGCLQTLNILEGAHSHSHVAGEPSEFVTAYRSR
ncbi:hypothetical protein KKP04_11985 [Rhodomicrobium sp. Az07]|uniref:hypothetical protein n=1 Tax=Rhodomicrobium sp. Az07 TaxID=2839034 RepID=UPI001BE7F018|nr:hypothetical protein [Rhodomicrobium sp. Az07]MBT3071585.1 hypothetical protein [Rhodomicrobium sp. Az07]